MMIMITLIPGNYDPDDAWPTLIDEFVRYVRPILEEQKKNRKRKNSEMDE